MHNPVDQKINEAISEMANQLTQEELNENLAALTALAEDLLAEEDLTEMTLLDLLMLRDGFISALSNIIVDAALENYVITEDDMINAAKMEAIMEQFANLDLFNEEDETDGDA